MASAFVCATLGIVPTVRHADYLGAWLDVLREDARVIFRAASQAGKAADFVLGQGKEALKPGRRPLPNSLRRAQMKQDLCS